MEPNAVTFLCVLFVCSHGSLVEEGLQYFTLMKETYGGTRDGALFLCC